MKINLSLYDRFRFSEWVAFFLLFTNFCYITDLYFFYPQEVTNEFIVTQSLLLMGLCVMIGVQILNIRNFLNPFSFYTINFFLFNYLSNCIDYQVEVLLYPKQLFYLSNIFLTFHFLGAVFFSLFNKNFIFFQKNKFILSYLNDKIEELPIREIRLCYKIAFYIGIFLLAFHYIVIIRDIPIFREDREDFRVIAKSGKGQLLMLGTNFLLLSSMVFGIFNIKMQNIFTLRSILTYTGIIFFLALSGYRADAFKVLVILYLTITIYRKKYVSYTFLLLSLIIALLLVGFSAALRWGSEGVDLVKDAGILETTLWSFSRANSINEGLDQVFRVFYTSDTYLWGYSYVIDLATILPGYQPNFGFWLKDNLQMSFSGSVMIGDQGIYFINFGFLGVCLLAFLNSYFVLGVYKNFILNKLTFKKIVVIYILGISFAGIGDISSFIYYTFILLILNEFNFSIVRLIITGQKKNTNEFNV